MAGHFFVLLAGSLLLCSTDWCRWCNEAAGTGPGADKVFAKREEGGSMSEDKKGDDDEEK